LQIAFFIFKYLAVDTLILLSFFNVGSLVAPLTKSSVLERYFLRSTLGLGIWGTVIFLLGILHLLYGKLILLIFALSLLFKFKANLEAISKSIKGIPKWTGLDLYLAIFLLVCCSFQFLSSLYPPHSFDDTMYHLASAQLYLKHHALTLLPSVRYPVFNEQVDMLFTAALGALDDIAAQQISFLANLLILIGIYSFLKRQVNARAGIIGCSVWLSSQLAAKLSVISYVDVPLALMCLAATYTAWCLCIKTDRQREFAILCGAFCGFAAGAKYTGIVIAIAICGCILAYGVLKRATNRQFYLDALWVPLLTVLLSAPWFIRNFILTGNPVFPFLPTVFGLGGLWTPQDYALQVHDFALYRYLANTPLNYLRALWDLSSNLSGDFIATYSPLFFTGTLLSFIFALSGNLQVSLLLVPTLCFLIPWFLTSQYPRYAIPVLPIASLYTGMTIELLISRLVKNKVILQGITYGVCFCAVILALMGSIGKGFRTLSYYGAIPVTASERKKFLGHVCPTYTAYDYLNKLPKGNLYSVADEWMNYYYVNGTFMGDWFGRYRISDILSAMNEGKGLYEHLARLDTKYFLISKISKSGKFSIPEDAYFHQHFSKIFEDSACVVYTLVP
jgi:Dolichyl-phosphate-mannose-protein mannosyltransferase